VKQDTTYVAFDTSKETIAVAVAEGGQRGEVRFYGTIASRAEAVRKLIDKLARRHRQLAFCYEAGPTGYGLYCQMVGARPRMPRRRSVDGAGAARRPYQDRSA
jgi:transposase